MIKKRRVFLSLAMLSLFLYASYPGLDAGVSASTLVPGQVPLLGDDLFANYAFQTKLPVFGPGYNADLPRVNAVQHPFLTVTMKETSQQVLPPPYAPTRVWTYEYRDTLTNKLLGPAHWPAVSVEARRFIPTVVKYVNELPSFDPLNPNGPGLVQGLVTVDQTIHWANPLGDTGMMNCMEGMWNPECSNPYTGPVPAVAHLHGGETPSAFDGGPEQWFTPDGLTGNDYRTLDNPGPGKAIYLYNNFQEPGTLWFHDHALGSTRTNVYSGLAAFFSIKAPLVEPQKLPNGAYDIELAFQDRQFDTNGQLFFPDSDTLAALNGPPPNPAVHPFWNPEFIGDVAIVNGAPWPKLEVEPRRYLFRLLDGSNARFYNLSFGNAPVYVIGRDDAYLDRPVPVQTVLFAPGQRVYVIVDFTGMLGQTVTVTNDAAVPFPDGLVPGLDQPSMGSIMQFKVSLPVAPNNKDTSCNPATGGCGRPWLAKAVRLTDGNGNLAAGVKIAKKRQLILKEVQGGGGPLEVLVNNTKWDGLNSAGIKAVFPTDGVSELPRVGSTEIWEIINLTMDAHPMHTHLVQFQILNRESYNVAGYLGDDINPGAWTNAFGSGSAPLPPGCTAHQYCPGYGPPLAYNIPNGDGAVGGNPAISPFLLGDKTPPAPEENGWHDTAIVWPGQVMRIVVRWAPTSSPVNWASPGKNLYPFDPTDGPGYVWHCHIVDHEDNEMMRPYKVIK